MRIHACTRRQRDHWTHLRQKDHPTTICQLRLVPPADHDHGLIYPGILTGAAAHTLPLCPQCADALIRVLRLAPSGILP